METASQLNVTEMEDPAPDSSSSSSSSNCCSPVIPSGILELEDSTKLAGVQAILILSYSTIILFGVTGNSLVIYVVYR